MNLSRTKVFRRYLASYALLMAVSLCVLIYFFFGAYSLYFASLTDTMDAELRYRSELVDARLNELDVFFTQVANNTAAKQMARLNAPLHGEAYGRMVSARTQLFAREANAVNAYYSDYIIYFFGSGIVLSNRISTGRVDEYFGSALLNYPGMTYQDWANRARGGTGIVSYWEERPVQFGGVARDALTYARFLFTDELLKPRGVVFSWIDPQLLLRDLNYMDVVNRGWLVVEDAQGNRITGCNMPETFESPEVQGLTRVRIDGEKQLLTHYIGPTGGWRFTWCIPERVLTGSMAVNQNLFIAVAIVMIAVDIAIVVIMARRNARPVFELSNYLRERVSGIGEEPNYQYIKDGIANILSDNNRLRVRVEEQLHALRIIFAERLFRGEFSNAAELDARIEYLGLKLPGPFYTAAAIELRGDASSDAAARGGTENAKLLLISRLQESLPGNAIIHNAGTCSIAVLCSSGRADDGAFLKRVLEGVVKEAAALKIPVTAGVSAPYEDLFKTEHALRQAYRASARAQWIDVRAAGGLPGVLTAADLPDEGESGIDYPLEMERRLVMLIKAGSLDELETMIGELYTRNFVNRFLDEKDVYDLVIEMRGTAIKLRDLYISRDAPVYLETLEDLRLPCQGRAGLAMFTDICGVWRKFAVHFAGESTGSSAALVTSVWEYIRAGFANPDLCLAAVASEFHLSERYLSKLFREHTGRTISDVIEEVRMQKAGELILENRMSVQAVSAACGYQYTNTFHKAFKRFYAVNPGAYLHSHTLFLCPGHPR